MPNQAIPMPAAVILWWGSDLRILGCDGAYEARTLGEREDPADALAAMAGDTALSGGAVRFIYHPAALEAREIACPNVGMARLRRLVSAEHPMLRVPDTLWCVVPNRSAADGHIAMLYTDARSRLPRLVREFARGGIRTEGAWPLQTLVEATPPCDGDGRASIGVVAVRGHALVRSANAHGDRLVRFHDGPDFADSALQEVGTALALFEPGEPVPALGIAEDATAAVSLRERLAGGRLSEMSMPEFLSRARHLEPGGPADFLPRRPMLARGTAIQAFATALGLVLMAASGWSACSTWKGRQEVRDQDAAAGERSRRLREEVAGRRAIQSEMALLDQRLDLVKCRKQSAFDLLMAMSRFTPAPIVLRELTVDGGGFSIRGRCSASDPGTDNPLSALRTRLSGSGAPWLLSDSPAEEPAQGGQDFAMRGAFR